MKVGEGDKVVTVARVPHEVDEQNEQPQEAEEPEEIKTEE
jgi:hypothetical protein